MEGPYGEARAPAGRLARVLVRPPDPADAVEWRAYGWRSAPDPGRLRAEHEAFRDRLADAGAEVVVGQSPVPGDPDAVYVRDPILIAPSGAVVLRPGKEARRGEPAAVRGDLERAGVPTIAVMEPPATAEGGDLLWLDERTLVAGRSHRTNDAGIGLLRDALPGIDVLAFDLPRLGGPAEVLHLMSLLSPLDGDLAVAFRPLLPVRLDELLASREVELVEVPEEEFAAMGPNVLALGPRLALAREGSPETRRRMERRGVEVRTYPGDEISGKGDGGPTCLTLPLRRDPAPAASPDR